MKYEVEDGDLICPVCGWEKKAATNWAASIAGDRKFQKSIFGLDFRDPYFEYRGREYKYSDIADIQCNVTNTKHYTNYVPSGKTVDVFLKIKMISGKRLRFFDRNRAGEDFAKGAQQTAMLSAYRTLQLAQREESLKERIRRSADDFGINN